MDMENLQHHNGKKAGKLNLRAEVGKYLKHWPWFVLSFIVLVGLGFIHLRYSTPIYSAKASIIIKDESGRSSGAEFLEDLGIASVGTSDFDNELGILSSRRLMREVVKSLNLHVQYFLEGEVRNIELYERVPFNMQILRLDEDVLRSIGGASFELTKTGEFFRIRNLNSMKSSQHKAGSQVNLGFADVVFSANELSSARMNPVIVQFSDIEKLAEGYRSRISLTQKGKNGGLIELGIEDPVKEKAAHILDQLILEYNRDAIENKNLIAGNTANFINERLDIINGELDSVETGKEVFKETNRLTDIQAQSHLYMQNANDYNKSMQDLGTQLELSNAMLEYINSSSNTDLLPTNLGIAEGGVNQRINEYNDIVLERNRVLRGSSEKNPVVINLNNEIGQIKGNVVQSLESMRTNLRISQDDIQRQAASIGSQIYSVPSKERQYRDIERQQSIKETLYLFLLKKREENSLALAITEPKARIVDRAYFGSWPIAPIPRNIYLGTFILALFIPVCTIYAKNLLDNKIRLRADIEDYTRAIPLVGMIPKVSRRKLGVVGENDRSILAESFRILTTNLQYLLVNSKDKSRGKVLLISSTVKGEGKSFTAINLAATLSSAGNKVLLLGMDLRSPRIQSYQEGDYDKGVSDYLVHDDWTLEELVRPAGFNAKLDIISSGTIPPNPYELLKQDKVATMFSILKGKYDYVIVDSAPAMLVADTFQISQFADATLYLVRSGFTEKDLLDFPLESTEKGRFHNISFVLNGVKASNLGYGTKYAYGYGDGKTGFWSRKTPRVPSKGKVIPAS